MIGRADTAWRAATVAASLNLFGMPVDLVIARSVPEMPIWPMIASMVVAVVLLAVLLAIRHRRNAALSNVLFVVNALAVVAAIWFTNQAYAQSGQVFVPFQEHKLGMVTIALLAPEMWVGAVSIGANVGAALLQTALLNENARSHFALAEPWATLGIGAFCAILFAYRLRRHALEREVARAQARVETTQRYARLLLTVRDLSNTPLQTIMFAAATARAAHPELGPVMDHIERSLEKLRALDNRMRQEERNLRWTESEASFPPRH